MKFQHKTSLRITLPFLLTATFAYLSTAQAGIFGFGDDPAIEVCEYVLKAKLKAPSSYKRITSNIIENKVAITYDAVNSFNAPIRGGKVCYFSLTNEGKYTFIPSDEYTEALTKITEEIKALPRTKESAEKAKDYEIKIKKISDEAMDHSMEVLNDLFIAEARGDFPIPADKTDLKEPSK